MRRSLLNKLNTSKPLRQALVLLTLLLLPSAAWGQTKITVAGDALTESGTIANQNIQGTVSYDANNKILTLNNATITGSIIWNPETNTKLTIKIIGACKVESSGAVCIENLGTSTGLSIEKDNSSTGEASLYLSANAPGIYSIKGFSSLSYNGFNTYSSSEGNSPYSALTVTYTASGLTWESGQESGPVVSVSFKESYNLWIGDMQVAIFNKDDVLNDGGTVKFTPATTGAATLSLNNATITGNIVWDMDNALTIQLTGENTIDGYVYSNKNVALSFTYPSERKDSYLTVGKSDDLTVSAIRGFSGVTLANGLSYEEDVRYNANDKVLKYSNGAAVIALVHISYHYGLTVGGIAVTCKSLKEDGSITNFANAKFAPATTSPATSATLTLTGVDFTGCIEWNNSEALKIALSGTNKISNTNGAAIIGNGNNNTTLTFVKASEGGTLVLSGLGGIVITGFSNSSYVSSGSGLYFFPEESSTTITSTLLGGGSGTSESPFLIKTYDDLKDFATYVNNGTLTTEYVELYNDIDCTDKTDFVPIGSYNHFRGNFDGNYQTISNLVMTDVDNNYVGLFAYNEGEIDGLILSGCTISGGNGTNNFIGAIAGNNNGNILDSSVKNCNVSCKTNSQIPFVGGIAGQTSNVIINCVVENTNVNAVTSDNSASGATAWAGGIAGSNENGTINNCVVKGTTTVTTDYSSFSTQVYAGAVIGKNSVETNSGNSGNTYESTVKTRTKGLGDTDYTVKSGYTQRGIGNSNDVIGQVELAGTKTVTVKFISSNGNDSWNAVEGTYYTYTSTNTNYIYYVLPGCNFTFSMKPKDGYKPRFALSDNTIKVTAVEKTENEAYHHTEFTFTMPNADLEVTWSYPIDLAAISADNFSIDDANYTGEAIVPTTVKVKGAPGSAGSTRQLTKDEDFTIKGYKLNGESVDSPVEIGIYTVTIEGIGEYIGTQDVSYEIIKAYALKINGTQLNAKNIDDFYGNGTVKFTPATETEPTNTLTLNGASIYGAIESGLGDLTIHLTENNEIKATGNETALIVSTSAGALTFETDATSGGSLKFTDVDGSAFANPISGFSSAECLIVEGSLMTDDRSIGTATSGITYNSTEKILTFNSYAGDLTSQIKTGVQGLTIKLKGTSTVAAGSLDYPFKAMTNTASILFDGENGSETGSLVMDTNSDSAPFEGFAEGAITYNKVVYSRGDGGNNIHTIKAPTAPAMSLDNEKVKLTKDYDDGTIYYSIAYADDTPSETGVKYTEPFAITHPGVVTAWVEANNATTSTVTGKHFAYQDAPYTMAINGIKTPTLLPTIAEGDVISLQRYASEDEDIASFIDGLITAKKPGTVTLSAILTPGDNTPFKVLNPVSDPNAPNEHTVSFSVYVGENLSNYFEGSNEFGTFYNEDSEIYAVPQGMKAYVVTGVSGSKLVIEETTVLPPNTVVLLEKGSAISFTKVPAEGAAPGGNLLKHATAEVSVTTESSLYVLYNDTYVKATAGSPIPTGKNYLDLSASTNAGTRGFYNILGEDDGSTGISEVKSEGVNSEKWNGEWFDLQGLRLPAQPTKPGLYLHNGHKVVIK